MEEWLSNFKLFSLFGRKASMILEHLLCVLAGESGQLGKF